MELKAKLLPRWPSTLAPTPKKAGKRHGIEREREGERRSR